MFDRVGDELIDEQRQRNRADYKWAIDIEICVFPQEGLTNYPGTDELLVEGLKRGATVVGGAPIPIKQVR
jgi:cytosine/creatinine deaminase